ncbi:MAG: peptide ABC transporter substrate-binding protein [Chloroflexota bacterium]|nr:peptide ABC transporter substrate-binding protein [Chloroflexota bacterium]
MVFKTKSERPVSRVSDKKTRAVPVLFILLTLVLGACNNSSTVGPAQSVAATTALSGNFTPLGGLKEDTQVLNLAGSEVSSFDPALVSEAETSFVLRQIYSGLVTLDQDLKVIPDLAVRLPEITEQDTLYTFTLRPGLKFQSGREVTAEEIRFSLERATDPKLVAPDPASVLPANSYMSDIVGAKDKLEGRAEQISGLTVRDKYTLQIKIETARPSFLVKMTNSVFFVLNPDAVANGFEQPDGTGPFKLLEYKPGQFLKLARNPSYAGRPAYLSQVNFALGANSANGLVQYEQGKFDALKLTPNETTQLLLAQNNPLNQELLVKPELALTYLGFNIHTRPFDEPKVRQAFASVVDRAKVAQMIYNNKLEAAMTLVPPGLTGYTDNKGAITYDINHARDLIAQSSYRSPANLPKITLYSTGNPLAGALKEIYKQAFDLEVEVRQYDYKDFQSGLSQRQFQIYLFGWTAEYPDPENFLRSLLGTGSPFNESGYNNQKFDDLLKQGDQEANLQKRWQLYGQAEALALGEVPLFPLKYGVNYLLVKPYVKGLNLTAVGLWNLKDVSIQK